MKKFFIVFTVFCIGVTLAIFLPFSRTIDHTLPNAVDPVFYAWNLSHNTQSALHGFKNLLDTNIFYPEGNTLAFSDTLYAQTLFTAPIIILTKNPVLAENLYVLMTFPLAAIAMFLLAYYLTGHALASGIAGIFYAFSIPRLSQIGHIPAVSSQWLPLFFLYLIRYIREGKYKNLLLLFTWYALSIASSVYFGVFLLPLALVTIVSEFIGQTKTIAARIKTSLVFVIPAVLILIILLFPYIRLKAEYPTIKRPLIDTVSHSATLTDYVSVLSTSWLTDIGFPKNTNEHALYPTFTLMILAILSFVLTDKKDRKVLFSFMLIAITALILSFGPYQDIIVGPVKLLEGHMPYYYLYQMFSLFRSVRVPARFSIFVVLGLVVAAAYTLARILKNTRYRHISIIILLLFLAEVWQIGTPSVSIPLQNSLPPVYSFLTNIPDDSVIVELPIRLESEGLTMEDQLLRQYSQVTEQDTFALEAYRTYFSSFHGKRILNGYSGYFPNVYHDHIRALSTFPTTESLTMLRKVHVRYILIHAAQYVSVPFAEIERSIHEFPQLKKVAQFGNDYVYTL
ncbi:MAG: hypothetical protein NTY06_01615 [Candidatus Gottesmanbacteria bacterium]|nr:hypothetical protein [Candidatus Gottesmanbacteria bacterium]